MDRDAPPRDGIALLQRYCNENATSAQRATRKLTQVIDFIMGRDGFEPSTSGLKVTHDAPECSVIRASHWYKCLSLLAVIDNAKAAA